MTIDLIQTTEQHQPDGGTTMITSEEIAQRRAAKRAQTGWRVVSVRAHRTRRQLDLASAQGQAQGRLTFTRIALKTSKQVSLYLLSDRAA